MIEITNDQEIIDTEQYLMISALIKTTVNKTLEILGFCGAKVCIAIVDNQRIQTLNRQYRQIDQPTDVLSFANDNFEFNDIIELPDIGDIAISFERAKEQAKEYGHSIEREIAFLTAHGMLHLLGYDHMNPSEEKEMFEMQNQVLLELNIER